jgi:hypothetical protein
MPTPVHPVPLFQLLTSSGPDHCRVVLGPYSVHPGGVGPFTYLFGEPGREHAPTPRAGTDARRDPATSS